MNWPIPGDGMSLVQPTRWRGGLVGLVLAIVGSLAVLTVQPMLATASGSQPVARAIGSDVTPTPRPPRPQINPVSPNDDTVVRPDVTTGGEVNGLPTSGIGFTSPADQAIQRWTNLAVAAFALNALVLFGIAIWSLRRRRR